MGDRLFGDDGETIELDEVLGEGGEGVVYRVRGTRPRAAKIYAARMSDEQHEKLRAMRRAPPRITTESGGEVALAGIAWPQVVLYRDAARAVPAGFAMARYPAARELHMIFQPGERMVFAGDLTWTDLHELAARFAEIVAGVHRAGHCVGDINARNVLVSIVAQEVVWIDTDSFQIRAADGRIYPCRVACPEYTPPEIERGDAPRTAASDAYALAVLVHQVLTLGAHPFDGIVRGADCTLERRMKEGLTPIAGEGDIAFPPDTLPFGALRPALRALFRRAFVAGTRDPRARPSAAEWASALRAAARGLVRCRAVATHRLSPTWWRPLSFDCPWCASAARTGLDVFPKSGDWPREIARHARPSAAPRPLRERWFDRHVQDRLHAGPGRLSYEEGAWLLHAAATLDLDETYAKKRIAEIAGPPAAPAPPSLPPPAPSPPPAPAPPLPAPVTSWPWPAPSAAPAWMNLAGGLAPLSLAALLVGPPLVDPPSPASVDPSATTWSPPSARSPSARPSPQPPSPPFDVWVRAAGARAVRLRDAPSNAARGTRVRRGAKLAALGEPVIVEGRRWVPIRTPSGRRGWIADADLSRVEPAPARPPRDAPSPRSPSAAPRT